MIFNKRKYFLALSIFGFTQAFAHNCKELLSLHEISKENKTFSTETTSPQSLSGSHDLKDVDYSNLKFTEVEKPGKNSAVYKTEINGEPYYYRPLEKNEAAARNGLAAHELAKALDLPYLAPEAKKVRIIRNGILEEGVLSKSAKGQIGQSILKNDFQMKETNLDEAQVFTYLTANTDAHLNNFFVNENGKLEFFDFDQSFGQIQKPHIQKKQDVFSDLEADSTVNPSATQDSNQQRLSLRSLERASTVKRETPQELSDLEAASTIKDSQRNMPLGLGTHLPSEISLELHSKLEKLKDFKAQNLSAEGQRLFNERLNDLLKIPTSDTLDIFPKLKSKVAEESFLNMDLITKKYVKKEFSPKEFIDEWAYKMKTTSSDYNNPRLQENIRLLQWGVDNNLIQIKLTDKSSTPHVKEIYLPEPVTVWLPPNGVLSIVSHELDHAADILRYLKKNIEEKNITDLSLKNLAQHIENTRNTHKETFYKEKQAERMARLSEENIAVRRERFSFVYPRITAIEKLILKNQPLTLEQSTQLTKYFKDIFRIEDRYMNVKKRKSIIRETESFMDWAKSEPDFEEDIKDPAKIDKFRNLVSKSFKISLPQDGKITPDYLKNLLKESHMSENYFTHSQYEMLVPYAQKAYESLK